MRIVRALFGVLLIALSWFMLGMIGEPVGPVTVVARLVAFVVVAWFVAGT